MSKTLLLLFAALSLSACQVGQSPAGAPAAPPSASGAPSASPESSGEEMTLEVKGEQVACTGVAPQQCLQIRRAGETNWSLWYSGIEGFVFTPGQTQTLIVRVEQMANPPADGSSLRYHQVRVLSSAPDAAEPA
ncbi:MAG: DUF4377 domain-containing protein [Candidatus Sericytochromatia bacterium]